MMSASEEINDPHDHRQRKAQNNASDDRKVEAAMAALICDIPRQPAKAERQSGSEEKQRPGPDQKDAGNEQQLAEFAERIGSTHDPILNRGLPRKSRPKID